MAATMAKGPPMKQFRPGRKANAAPSRRGKRIRPRSVEGSKQIEGFAAEESGQNPSVAIYPTHKVLAYNAIGQFQA